MIIAVQLPWALTITIAGVVAIAILWYWVALDKPNVPASRRRIRRTSMVVMLVSLPVFVQSLSFINHQANPSQFVTTWTMLIVLLLLLIFTAIIDAVTTMKLHSEKQIQEMAKAAADMLNKARQGDE